MVRISTSAYTQEQKTGRMTKGGTISRGFLTLFSQQSKRVLCDKGIIAYYTWPLGDTSVPIIWREDEKGCGEPRKLRAWCSVLRGRDGTLFNKTRKCVARANLKIGGPANFFIATPPLPILLNNVISIGGVSPFTLFQPDLWCKMHSQGEACALLWDQI